MGSVRSAEGVILAAGTSVRAGAFKPGLLLGGKPMLRHCIEGMDEVCRRIIVVGGYEFARIQALAGPDTKVVCVENLAYRNGMFTSVKAGLALVRAERCFVLPGDVPLVPARVYRMLLETEADIVVPVFHGAKGHPVCLSKEVIPRILSEPDDSILREIIRTIGDRSLEVDAEEILLDVDTPEDYDMVCRRFSERMAGGA